MNTDSHNASTDSQLLAIFANGSEEVAQSAFHQLVVRYERLVWTVCRRQLNNACDVEDAFQSTFMLLAIKSHRIKRPEALANWLFSVAWKTASRIRKSRHPEPITDDDIVCWRDDSPFDQIARKHRNESIDRQLGMLDEKYRTPLVLFYFAGLTTGQIASQLNLSLSAVEGRLRRGRARLRVELTGQGIMASPMMGALLFVPGFTSSPSLVAVTCEGCFTTTTAGAASAATGVVSGSLDTGAKLMICKCAVSLALISLLTIGGLAHLPTHVPAADGDATVSLAMQMPDETAEHSEFVFADDDEDNEFTHDDMLNSHLHHLHLQAHRHIHHILMLFHGSGDDAHDLHFHHEHDGEHSPDHHHGMHDHGPHEAHGDLHFHHEHDGDGHDRD
ncbi:MAG: RNA polymerase sigma factor [Pirellulaceae bacterium]